MLILLKKDCRVNSVAIIGSAILQTMVYIVMGILGLVAMYYDEVNRQDVRDALVTASFMGLAIMALMAAIYGASAFALERRERSSDFLGTLPVQRWRIIASKLLVATACLLVVWLINISTLWLAGRGGIFGPGDTKMFPLDDRMQMVEITSAIALMAFGLGWVCSTFLSSAGVAASISIAATLGVISFFNVLAAQHWNLPPSWEHDSSGHYYPSPGEVASWWILKTAVWTGLVSLAVGTIYYLRRSEP